MTNLQLIYQLDECLDWILENKFTNIALQFRNEDLRHSVAITSYLDNEAKKRSNSDSVGPLNFYVTQTNTCCVDLLVVQHVATLEAIIHFGKVCLSKPELENQERELPILFVFGHSESQDEKISQSIEEVLNHIKSIRDSDESSRIFVAYDTNLIDQANRLREHLQKESCAETVTVAALNNPCSTWQTTKSNEPHFVRFEGPKKHLFGYYVLDNPVEHYNCAIYLGNRNSIQLTLDGPPKQYRINLPERTSLETINVSKVLNRRMALVGRLKDEEQLNVGVILTNPLPNVTRVSEHLEGLAKPRKHTLYFISMIQTIDECKIGNFDLCDAFVVINSCTCSTILESLVFNRPIITEHEFKLACGFEAEYGRVLWPGSSSHLSADDMINKRKVSDVSLALIHTRNELLERCSQARTNKWSGMEYKASSGGDGGDALKESLDVMEGLRGIASSYASEPLQKSSSDTGPRPCCSGSSNAMCSDQGADNKG